VPTVDSLFAVKDPLAWRLYQNTIAEWLVALAIAIGVVAALLTLRRFAGRQLLATALRTVGAQRDADELAVNLVRRIRVWFIVLVAVALGRLVLTLAPRWDRAIDAVFIVGLLLQVASWANGIITYTVDHYAALRSTPSGEGPPSGPSAATVLALTFITRIVLWVILGLIALDNLGIHITTLIAGLGISGIAIALAVQNILGDLFAALAIVLDKPFVVGDGITVDAFSGTVERIGLKTTRVRGPTGEEIIFSNADLLKSRIRNMQRLQARTVVLTLTLDGRMPADKLVRFPALVREVISAQPRVRFDRAHLTAIAKGDVGFEAVYIVLTQDYVAFLDAQQSITLGVLERCRHEGLRLV
jgi:small-conductance mechanosensitive channel